jgi:hypothetical protein
MSDELILREKAREAIRSGKLPGRRPDRTWAGPGLGVACAICALPGNEAAHGDRDAVHIRRPSSRNRQVRHSRPVLRGVGVGAGEARRRALGRELSRISVTNAARFFLARIARAVSLSTCSRLRKTVKLSLTFFPEAPVG